MIFLQPTHDILGLPLDPVKTTRIRSAWHYAKTNKDPMTKRRWRRIRGAIAARDSYPPLIRSKPYKHRVAKFYQYLLQSRHY